ncbi:MAG: type II toxin-antitoxin system VapC family toxin [Leptolyngbyaceae cyanobacterium]
MYVLDTNHLSAIERGGANAAPLKSRLAGIDPTQVATTIISYEEQVKGWLRYIAQAEKSRNIEQQVVAYRKLKQQLANYCAIPILEFGEQAAQAFEDLRRSYPRLGKMDLKIAAIALVNQAILLTQNTRDFERIDGLVIEDWTIAEHL